MTEVIATVSILIFLGVREYFDRKERKDIYRLLMSKTVEEAAHAEVIEKTEPTVEEPPDEIPMSEVSDEDFIEAIKKN